MALRAACVAVCLIAVASHTFAATTYSTYDAFAAQLRAKPYNASLKHDAVESIRRTLPLYAFIDISQNSPDPNIPMSVNLEERLGAVDASDDFKTDADVQEALAEVFRPLYDAHTRYNKPPPFRYSFFALPFRLNLFGGKVLRATAKGDLLDQYAQLYPDEASNVEAWRGVAGWEVVSIDGRDAMVAVTEFANNAIGYTKEANSRFNLAVNGYGDGLSYMFYRPQSMFPIPAVAKTAIELKSPAGETVSLLVRWMGLYTPPAGTLLSSPAAQRRTQTHELEMVREITRAQSVGAVAAPDASFTTLKDGTGVLRVTTFVPANYTTFTEIIEDAIASHRAAGGKRLLLDLRANGGGDICLGYALLRFLFPTVPEHAVPGAYDMRMNPLFETMARSAAEQMRNRPGSQLVCANDPEKVGYMTPCAWRDAYTDELYADASWAVPGRKYTRGGNSAQFSQRIHETCSYRFADWTPRLPSDSYDEVWLLSDGLCGSTCAVFSSFIQMRGLGRTVAIGGSAAKPDMQFFSFPGGEVEDVAYIAHLAAQYGVTGDLVPKDFADGAIFRFAIREIYPWDGDDSAPLEFRYVPAMEHIYYESAFDDTDAVYEQVSRLWSP